MRLSITWVPRPLTALRHPPLEMPRHKRYGTPRLYSKGAAWKLGGVDTLSLESLCVGADGLVAGLVDAFPKETVAMYKLVKANRLPEALAIYRWFMPVLELDIHPKLVQYIKLAAASTGIGSTNVRAPRLQVTGEELKEVQGTIDRAIATRPTLPDYLNL